MRTYRLPQMFVWMIVVVLLAVSATRARAGVLYAADGAGPNPNADLLILDPATGAVLQTVGPIGFSIGGIAVHPITGEIYGTTGGRGPSAGSLIRIDPATGAGTRIGSLGIGFGTLSDIAFDSSGNLFGVSGPPVVGGVNLYSVDLSTGTATRIGDSGSGIRGGGIAISPNGTVYVAGQDNGMLATADRTTGLFTEVATLSGAPLDGLGFLKAMSFDENGTLFAIDFEGRANGEAYLITVDPQTGAITARGLILRDGESMLGVDAIAFAPGGGPPTVIPEPTSLALAGLGLAGLLGHRWRRRQ